ncbi:tail protein [Vibrio phage SSP002]|uniref:Tip attachment protein J domain-containing protein n=1 Tax=Vibrio phage SSP002 TaxID=1161928 RepID=H9EB49_9CAUD|nr:tail protein [Vibrio phage SSP002]AFE86376.1 hypothetical protein SSP002_049 [Vibrio phage SSP002]
MGGGGSKSQVVGYKYWGAMQLVLCHRGLESIDRIRVGDKVVSSEVITQSNCLKYIDKWNTFGGDKREGGPVGFARFFFGSDDQPVSSLTESMYQSGTAFRGVVSVSLPKMYFSANNPYIKPWSFRVRSYPDTPGLARTHVKIDAGNGIVNMNPAHIIYACLVSRSDRWGLGLDYTKDIDVPSFASAASALYAEKFGIGIAWENNSGVDDFIKEILRHIDGAIYVDQVSGKLKLKLFRGDYTVSDLPVLDKTVVKDLEKFEYPQWGNITTQVTVSYVDAVEGKEKPVTVHNMAARDVQGRDVPVEIDFPGINTRWLASRVASRELNQLSRRLVNGVLICNRKASKHNIGDVVLVDLPDRELDKRIMRVVEKSYGSELKEEIRLTVIEDTFKTVDPLVIDTGDSDWTSPDSPPQPVDYQKLVEATYWEVSTFIGDTPIDWNTLGDSYGFIRDLAVSDVGFGYDIYATTGGASGTYTDVADGQFTNRAQLDGALGMPTGADSTVKIKGVQDYSLVMLNSPVLIGGELCWLKSVDVAASTITATRGIVDTVPTTHSDGTEVWFYRDTRTSFDDTKYTIGQTVHHKLLTKTPNGILPENQASAISFTITGRAHRPYPPARLRINNTYLGTSSGRNMRIEWAHRNRLMQSDKVPMPQTSSSIAVEPGTKYELKVVGASSGNVVLDKTGIEGTLETLDQNDHLYKLNRADSSVRIELQSRRPHGNTTLTSFTKWNHTVAWAAPETETVTPAGGAPYTLGDRVNDIMMQYRDSFVEYKFDISADRAANNALEVEVRKLNMQGEMIQVEVFRDNSRVHNSTKQVGSIWRVSSLAEGAYRIKLSNRSTVTNVNMLARIVPA